MTSVPAAALTGAAPHVPPLKACRGQKRPADGRPEGTDGLDVPRHLPDSEVANITAALERWSQFRPRVEELRPALCREDALMQEILDVGLRSEDCRTLRKLASGSAADIEDVIKEVSATIGDHKQKLFELLAKNQRELLELSATTEPEHKKELLAEMDSVRDTLREAQVAVHRELLAAKEKKELDVVRTYGRSLNDMKGLLRRLDGERREVTKNSVLAALLITVCRRILPIKQIDPSDLQNIKPSHEGYMRILDFYFFTDASSFCFGEHFSGPNWFTRLKRNIAILTVDDKLGSNVYNNFAASGEHNTPGERAAPSNGPLQSIAAEDEHGKVFDRQHDAEFKLLSGFCHLVDNSGTDAAQWKGSAVLWSKKPLCKSCAGAVRQLQGRCPHLTMRVLVGERTEIADVT